jgi:hypothetical protein
VPFDLPQAAALRKPEGDLNPSELTRCAAMNKVTESFLNIATQLARENPAAVDYLVERLPTVSVGEMMGLFEAIIDWRSCGFPLTVFESLEDAAALAETDPPTCPAPPTGGGEWGFEVGDSFVLYKVQWAHAPSELSDEDQVDFKKMMVLTVGACPLDHDQLVRLANNALFALTAQPQGIRVTERRPSAKAARKRGRKYYPNVEYVIGTTSPVRVPDIENVSPAGIARKPAEGWTMSVKTMVRGHWRQQPVGPGRLQRRPTLVRPHWRGPEDAPISVHATAFRSLEKAS